MTNFLPKTQGAMKLRPGTKYAGTSLSNQKAQWQEFVASTDDTALTEQTDSVMRIWIPDTGTGLHALLARDTGVDTTIAGVLATSDTGAWVHTDTGGSTTASQQDQIPAMTAGTTDGVTITASSNTSGREGWRTGDNGTTQWESSSGPPQWVRIKFSTDKTITGYSVTAADNLSRMARSWSLLGSDSGLDADTGTWTFLDSGGDQTGWSVGEKRSFTIGSPAAFKDYRFQTTEVNGGGVAMVREYELFQAPPAGQSHFNSVGLVLNAQSIGGLARVRQEVTVDTGNANVEHGLALNVTRGPVTVRVGSSVNDDDYIEETELGTGRHSLSVVPTGNFFITLQSKDVVDRIVASLALEAGGTVSLVTPYTDTGQLDNIRFDQSADVLYLDTFGKRPQKIERRGTGRSWSIVDYAPDNGPFLPIQTSSARLRINQTYGNATLRSDIPFFTSDHVRALFRLFHDGQNGTFILGNLGAVTEPIEMTGISDTGTAPGANSERRIVFTLTGTWAGTLRVQRSFDGPDIGFHDTDRSDTGTATITIDDPDDNLTVWYRGKVSAYTSGALTCKITYKNGGKTGICRITSFTNNQEVSAEVIKRFSDTGYSDNWGEGAHSAAQSYPSAPALYEGRLFHAGGAKVNGSVSDDYENFDDETEGDAGPIDRTLGRGPVDRAAYLLPLLRLVIGTVGSEISLRSSSTDEVLTPTNCSAKPLSTQGSANLRAVIVDSNGIFVQRSGKRVFAVRASETAAAFGEYESSELTLLVPDLLEEGVVSIAVQRQPDTRIHCVLGDGKVAILTYEKAEEVLCWSLWETDGAVEKVMVLPGEDEDQVYYHIRRTINGTTVRYLEKVAMEAECQGGPLNWLADCAVKYEDAAGFTEMPNLDHLVGESVIGWANDTGQATYGKDLSPDVAGVQTTYTVDTGGNVTLPASHTKAVFGLPYQADWTSTKLAYAAAAGTALAQMKRTDHLAFILATTHNNGLFFGRDTGHLDPMPRMHEGAQVDTDTVYDTYDKASLPFPGLWDTDSRIHLRAKAPRPATVMAIIPSISTHDKI